MTPQTVALFDARPFFEKALVYGVQHGMLDTAKLDAIRTDAPKGMVQIARYFGSEYLRPELEKARDRMVNLVSLHLEHSSGGDLHQAACLLRDHSFMSRSKAGSDMRKALIVMPQNSHFGMVEAAGFTDEHIPLLAKWAMRPLPDYQSELALRQRVALLIDTAVGCAQALGSDAADLEEAAQDAEAVIRTSLLVLASKGTALPDWPAFEALVQGLRKKKGTAPSLTLPPAFLQQLPADLHPTVEAVRQSVLADLPKILDKTLAPAELFKATPAYMGRYFWLEDPMGELDEFVRATSAAWDKATQGHADESSLLTLFLCVAAGSPQKTLLTQKSAASLVRKIRKSGLQSALVETFIETHAPHAHRDDYNTLWQSFLEEAQATLQSDRDDTLREAMALLRRECNLAS